MRNLFDFLFFKQKHKDAPQMPGCQRTRRTVLQTRCRAFGLVHFIFSPPQQETEGEHQRPDEDGAETGAGDDSQEHRGGSKAPHSGDCLLQDVFQGCK